MTRTIFLSSLPLLACAIWGIGWSGRFRPESARRDDPRIVRWVAVEALPRELALYESVFWEPQDTESLRKMLRETPLARGKSVLEIGTGSGLLAFCCWHAGATLVVATDVNPQAIACARANSTRLGAEIDFRRVSSTSTADLGAFSVIGPEERFDLIISNPPWENDIPRQWSEYAFYDPSFALLRSLLDGLREHLQPGGKVMLVYGRVEAIVVTQRLAADRGLHVVILDQRKPEDLPSVFLPGMLLGLTPDPLP